jgi:hypothetical protein
MKPIIPRIAMGHRTTMLIAPIQIYIFAALFMALILSSLTETGV